MGHSTDAIFFYGFPFDGDCEEKPWIKYDYNDSYEITNLREGESEDDDWLPIYRARANIPGDEYLDDDLPVHINYHCSDECAMYYIAVQASERRASRGYPVQINIAELKIQPEWNQQIKDFCQVMDIEYQEPAYYICSNTG